MIKDNRNVVRFEDGSGFDSVGTYRSAWQNAMTFGSLAVMQSEKLAKWGGPYPWGRLANPVFSFTADCADALINTEPPVECVLPFEQLLLQVPRCSAEDAEVRVMLTGVPEGGFKWQASLVGTTFIQGQFARGVWGRSEERLDYVKYLGTPPIPWHPTWLVRFVLNALQYINSQPLPAEKHRHGDPAAPVERIHKDRPLFRVGRPVRLDPGIRRYLNERVGGEPLWKLQHRFVVRGHWRNQACGEKHAERKRLWIEPHWKGPTTAEAAQRTYNVVGVPAHD